MSTFVEGLRRLYIQGKITTAQLDKLLADGKITSSDYEYITLQ